MSLQHIKNKSTEKVKMNMYFSCLHCNINYDLGYNCFNCRNTRKVETRHMGIVTKSPTKVGFFWALRREYFVNLKDQLIRRPNLTVSPKPKPKLFVT